jgi:hypothetical protein
MRSVRGKGQLRSLGANLQPARCCCGADPISPANHTLTQRPSGYGFHLRCPRCYPECERVIKEATGAARVVAFDHIVRNAAMAALEGSCVKIPAKRVHNDYTAWSSPMRVRQLMGDEAEELLKHRYAIINLWRPIRGPVLESPLTLCDAESLSEEDLVASDLKYPDRTGETYSITYNPQQRYYYFPRMQADEPVLIRRFDSARQGAVRFSAHTGFVDPTSPPRESIEVRTLVFFPPEV